MILNRILLLKLEDDDSGVRRTVSRVRGGGRTQLPYSTTKMTFEDVTSRIFCADRTRIMNINQGARDLVFSLTDAHLGAVASMLGAIYRVSVIHQSQQLP